MSTDYQKALGRKVAKHRRQRGLSQREFAGLVGRSETWVSQVERGVRKVDRMVVLEKLAEVLEIPVSELAAEAPIVAASNEEPPGSSRLRLILSGSHALAALLRRNPATVDLDDLRRRVDHAWELTHASAYTELTEILESLIPDLESAARSVPNGERLELFRLLNAAYRACSSTLSRLGEYEAAWIAADRAITAAERAEDPLLMAAGEFRLCLTFQGARHYDQVEATAQTACEALSDLVAEGNPEAMSVYGALTLQRAVAAARGNKATVAYRHVAEAKRIADAIGGERNDFNTEFGPANVGLHEVSVAVDLGDAGVALRAAEEVDVSVLSPERRGRFLIDVARAQLQRRNVDGAVATLEEAERVTPEQVHSHPIVRQVVGDLMAIQDPAGSALTGLARRVGAL
ncbi:helix-turn-helix domain-containing protein [Nocardiopsis changdeensis]|uniref:Helix-turn-helix transcriptional regulator n=1 Tax=Nocardiopsis changdeensis TaxID=2831969 RepID=A0ABX8BMX4_9ACTN|nr:MULTISPECIES: helix-turn-helix transcriptional regulator [Nocardiopsis]QUX22402.1 helix-turn-helix transcriptional regulator [Nocardiopsis changdeensis]QYX38344.1 helix-turn-helix domain-containing protein [Nocardiopsis sp. MT53]